MNAAGGDSGGDMYIGGAATEMTELGARRAQHHANYGNPPEPLPRAVTTGEYALEGKAAEAQFHDEMLRGTDERERGHVLDGGDHDAPPPSLPAPHTARHGFSNPTSEVTVVSLSREFQEAEGHGSQVDDVDLDLPEEFV